MCLPCERFVDSVNVDCASCYKTDVPVINIGEVNRMIAVIARVSNNFVQIWRLSHAPVEESLANWKLTSSCEAGAM
jgi:hypothetical protein